MALEVKEDRRYHRRERRFQLAGAVVVVAILLGALLGLAGGPGVFSSTTAGTADGSLRVEYERLVHWQADDSITIQVAPAAITGEEFELQLALDWVEAVDIRGITPEPDGQSTTDQALVLRITASPATASTITISFRAMDRGSLPGWVSLPGGERVAFRQFVLP